MIGLKFLCIISWLYFQMNVTAFVAVGHELLVSRVCITQVSYRIPYL